MGKTYIYNLLPVPAGSRGGSRIPPHDQAMSASDATLTEALAHLDSTWVDLRNSVLNDRQLIWVGSGISRERFPALPDLLEQLFSSLHASQNAADSNCPYFKAAEQIVKDYSHVLGLDLRRSPAAWPIPQKTDLFNELSSNYAKVLGTAISTVGGSLNVPFDILRLEKLYSEPTVTPDAEHRFLALLVAEGSVTRIVTTNWDPLTERAHGELGVGAGLWVIACTEELDGVGTTSMVFKIHGCAERTKTEPAKYKRHMVATHHEITRWSVEPFFVPFVEKLRTLLRERPSLFVGISGQDFDLQSQCVAATCNGPAIHFPPPRIIFSAASIGVPQREILRAVHGDDYNPNQNAIDGAAALPLFGKPLFGALYISLLFEKLRAILNSGDQHFVSDDHRRVARDGLVVLRDLLCARFDILAVIDRWRTLATEVPAFIARFLELYRNQCLPTTPRSYVQIHASCPDRMSLDPNLSDLNFHWLFLALTAISATKAGGWRLHAPTEADGTDGQLRVESPSDETSVFFLNQDVSAMRHLENRGSITAGSGRRVLLVYPNGREPVRPRRSPTRLLPRSYLPVTPREIWLRDIALEMPGSDDFLRQLKLEITAAHSL